MTTQFNAQDIRELTRKHEDMAYKSLIDHITKQAEKGRYYTVVLPSDYGFGTHDEVQNLIYFLETRSFTVSQNTNHTLTIRW